LVFKFDHLFTSNKYISFGIQKINFLVDTQYVAHNSINYNIAITQVIRIITKIFCSILKQQPYYNVYNDMTQ